MYRTFELDAADRPSFHLIRVSLEDFVQRNRGQISVLGGALLAAVEHLDDPTYELQSEVSSGIEVEVEVVVVVVVVVVGVGGEWVWVVGGWVVE